MKGFSSKRAAAASVARRVRHASTAPKIIWTHTDEAPALASYALLPVIQRFAKSAGVNVATSDISVSGRILSHFPEKLSPSQQCADELSGLGKLATTPEANIIKLPNVSASIPQLVEAIDELQSKGYGVPNFPASPKTDEEKDIAMRYAKVLGSAVNPVLREGNSDRRVAGPVKAYAQKNPHKMGKWASDSKTYVAHMSEGDFFSSEQSTIMAAAGSVRIEMVPKSGAAVTLKESVALEEGEVIDASRMSLSKLSSFLFAEFADAKKKNLMVSLHLKATMMKVSDPIMFGVAVRAYFAPLFEKHGDALAKLEFNPNNGLGELVDKLATLSADERAPIDAALAQCYAIQPGLAMVDSDNGITNLHVPSDVIIDASMPCVVRDSGKMWNAAGELEDTKAIIPDRCYATMYQAMIEDCKAHGQFDVASMGNVANVGLMAQKAEEYGSHDKTFQAPEAGQIRVVCNSSGATVFEHDVEQGDIWRMCQTKDAPIRDWVRLAVERASLAGEPAIFWLDASRAHDASLISKVETYLKEHDTSKIDISVAKPVDAIKTSMERARAGKDTISVTGNVLRDYLTDLFPILELGTSAKMLSIVPLLAGGGLYETGAGGSAPKHVQQFTKENHLRWDSLGEYLALAVSLESLGQKTGDAKIQLLGSTLNEATGKLLDNRKSPMRKVKQLDNRGSAFYIARYWSEAMAAHDPAFADLSQQLMTNEEAIVNELIECQGNKVDIGGYWKPDPEKVEKAMRPSAMFNEILDKY
jgi:isocitrate dehydrogenase